MIQSVLWVPGTMFVWSVGKSSDASPLDPRDMGILHQRTDHADASNGKTEKNIIAAISAFG